MSAETAAVDRRPVLGLLLAAGFVAALYAPTFLFLVTNVWLRDPNYMHGLFILPASLLLAWLVVQAHPMPRQGEPKQGIFTMFAGLVIHLFAVVYSWVPMEFVSLVLVLRGLARLLGGGEWANRLLFPTFFLVFLFPLPVEWTTRIAVALQEIVASVSAEVLGWFFFCYRRGDSIFVAGVAKAMEVGQECSGIRQIMAFIALGALIAYLGKTGRARGTLLVALAVPVAILANVLRVIMMALGLIYFGQGWFSTWMHDLPALFTVPFGILCFFVLVWLLTPSVNAKEKA